MFSSCTGILASKQGQHSYTTKQPTMKPQPQMVITPQTTTNFNLFGNFKKQATFSIGKTTGCNHMNMFRYNGNSNVSQSSKTS